MAAIQPYVGGGGGGGGKCIGRGGGGGVISPLDGRCGPRCEGWTTLIGRGVGNFCNLWSPGGEEKSSSVFLPLSLSFIRAVDGVPKATISGLGFVDEDDGRRWRSPLDFFTSKGELSKCLCDDGLLPLEWEFEWRLLELWCEWFPWFELLRDCSFDDELCVWELWLEPLWTWGVGDEQWWDCVPPLLTNNLLCETGVEWELDFGGWFKLCLDWNDNRLEDDGCFVCERCEEPECIVFSFLAGMDDSSCSLCLCLVPEATLALSVCPEELLLLAFVEFEHKPGILAYFVVRGCSGGSMTLEVGVSTTAALLVIVNIAELGCADCWLDCSAAWVTELDDNPPDAEWSPFDVSRVDAGTFDDEASFDLATSPFAEAPCLLDFSLAGLGRWPP